MKRILPLLLALTLLAVLTAPAVAEDAPLISWNGYSVELLSYKTDKHPNSNAYMYVYARVVNNTDRELSLWVDDATIDGTPVVVKGILGVGPNTDTGRDSPESFYIFAPSEGAEAASAAIASARRLEGTMKLKDGDTGETLVAQALSVDLDDIVGARTIRTPLPTATPTPRPTPEPTPAPTSPPSNHAPSYTPASYDFKTLKKGSRGQAVRDLQQRLTDLGYLNDRVDGSFGRNTATAVMSFCSQNGLYIQGEATPEMQRLLYSSSAEYYVKPWIPLIFGPEYKWENPFDPTLDNGRFYIQVVNRDPDRTIRGYELYYYKTDVWGNRYVEPNSGVELTQRITIQQTVQPGYTVYTQPITILPFSWTYSVWIGIHKIVFDDGEIREVPEDEIQYFGCAIKK